MMRVLKPCPFCGGTAEGDSAPAAPSAPQAEKKAPATPEQRQEVKKELTAKEALDRGYERSLRLGIPWTIADMERSLKHGTAKI